MWTLACRQMWRLSPTPPHFCSCGCCSTMTLPMRGSGSAGKVEHKQTDLGRLRSKKGNVRASSSGAPAATAQLFRLEQLPCRL